MPSKVMKSSLSESRSISLQQGLFWVCLSAIFFTGSCVFFWITGNIIWERYKNQPHYRITKIAHEVLSDIHLPEGFFAEYLHLSKEDPPFLYKWNQEEGNRMLRECPLLEEGSLHLTPPDTLHITYRVRTPCALLYDTPNMAIDKSGVCFPFAPFFSPKRLPFLTIGEGDRVIEKRKCALQILSLAQQCLHKEEWSPSLVDVAHLFSEKEAEREIVLLVQHDWKEEKMYLRLRWENKEEALAHFLVLVHHAWEKGDDLEKITSVDLRLPDLAYVVRVP